MLRTSEDLLNLKQKTVLKQPGIIFFENSRTVENFHLKTKNKAEEKYRDVNNKNSFLEIRDFQTATLFHIIKCNIQL